VGDSVAAAEREDSIDFGRLETQLAVLTTSQADGV